MKRIGLITGPLLFLIFYFFIEIPSLEEKGEAALSIAIWIAIWWLTEAIPIAATGLLPLVLFPLTGIMPVTDAAGALANQMIFLFLGGFIIASAIEKTNLHKRIALNIIRLVGTNWDRVLLGFMLASAVLSMWISNTATSVMMLPIGLAVVNQINSERKKKRKMGQALMLSIAYGCSVGGISTIIGTPTNIVFTGVVQDLYNQEIAFIDWMFIGLPFALIMLLIAWLYLSKIAFQGNSITLPGGKEFIEKELKKLGPINYDEKAALSVFLIVAFCWMSRTFLLQNIIPGINDTVIAIAGAIALFIIPSRKYKREGILDWANAENIPWGILLLFGGGLALAEAFKITGLAEWIGSSFVSLEGLPFLILLLIIVFAVNFLTEITSNVATAAMLMPILAALAYSIDIHPYALMIGATIASSCAFMLPVATPPNAVVFGSGYLGIPDMARVGIWMNLISIVLATILVYFLLPIVWKIPLSPFPLEFINQ